MIVQPEVSVVVPVHNVGQWVRECLSSMLDDQDVDLEIIVVDDNSTDDTRSVVAAVAKRDARLRLVRSVGSGGAQARNLGVELARGKFLVFCDGDDLVPRGAYARFLTSARATGADMVIGSFLKFWSTRTWRPTPSWPAFDENRIGVTLTDVPSLIRNRACWNRMIRRQFWLDERIYFPTVPRSNDIVPITKALISAEHIDVITDDVYLYRGRPGVASMTARAADLTSFTSYLSQELVSSVLVGSKDAIDLRAEYDSLFLSADGWVHLRAFLEQARPSLEDEDELERARGYLAAVLESLAPDSLADLPLWRRWVYVLAAAGRWAAAQRLIRAIKPASEPMPDAVWFVEEAAALSTSPIFTDEMLRETLDRRLVKPFARQTAPLTSDLLARLESHAHVFRRAFPSQILQRQSAEGQQLVHALIAEDHEGLKALLDDGLLIVRVESIAVRRGRIILKGAATGARPDQLRLYAASGDRCRDFPDIRWSADMQHIDATIQVSDLGPGKWFLRLAATGSVAIVDAPLFIPSAAVSGTGRRWARAVVGPQTRANDAALVVRLHLLHRAVQRIRWWVVARRSRVWRSTVLRSVRRGHRSSECDCEGTGRHGLTHQSPPASPEPRLLQRPQDRPSESTTSTALTEPGAPLCGIDERVAKAER
jgi:Glycosyl transferase family 2